MSKNEKISELEYKIRLLEQRGEAALSDLELVRLDTLKEQQASQKEQGWVAKKTVPVKLLAKFHVPVPKESSKGFDNLKDTETVKNAEEVEGPPKKKVPNISNFFVMEAKKALLKENPKGKLNMKSVRMTWKDFPSDKKIIMKKDIVDEQLFEVSAQVSKEKKKVRDLGYRKLEKETKAKEGEEKENFMREFDELLVKKERKLDNMMMRKVDLKSEIVTAVAENKVMVKMVSKLEVEEADMKSKIREVLNHHKNCKK